MTSSPEGRQEAAVLDAKRVIVAAMKQSFRDVVAGSSNKLFEDTGVTMPADHVWERYAAAALAALSTAIPAGNGVPPGMVLVPREPTEAMLRTAIDAIPMDKYIDIGARRSNVTLSTDECATIYRDMLSTASSAGKG